MGQKIDTSATIRDRYQRPFWIKLAYFATKADTSKMQFDEVNKLPLPPFWMLFNKAERVVMALLYICQKDGKFLNSDLKLYRNNSAWVLPWGYGTISKKALAKRFPIDQFTGEDARYLLTKMTDSSLKIPSNTRQFTELLLDNPQTGWVSEPLQMENLNMDDSDQDDDYIDRGSGSSDSCSDEEDSDVIDLDGEGYMADSDIEMQDVE